LAFFNKNLEMNPAIFFPNLDLLSHVSLFGMTYEVVTPMHMAQLQSTMAPGVPHQFSHAGVLGASHTQVTPGQVA
jgi:hypothetical protein